MGADAAHRRTRGHRSSFQVLIESTRAYADAVFLLEVPGEDGVSLREKLEHVEATTGKRPPALDHVELPDAARGAWNIWSDLHSGRSQNGNAVVRLSWLDMQAWCAMRHEEISYTDLELVRVIDSAYVSRANSQEK